MQKIPRKSKKEEIGIIQDILKVVISLIKKANELEDIAMELQKRIDSEQDINIDSIHCEEEDQTKNVLKCDLCVKKFITIFNLEKHIKSQHKRFQSYGCDHCGKTFVTKGSLEKHVKMHSSKKVRQCRYYRNGIHCPFDELGCKF